MDFAQAHSFWFLAGLPIVAGIVAIAARRRRAAWQALAQPGSPPGDGGWAWLVAMACFVVALAQPRWGREPGAPLPPGRDVALLIDVSWSMAAEDVVPNRLGKAVEGAEELTRAIGLDPGDRVAVVAFAGRGVVRCPLTTNLGAVVEVLQSLRPGAVEPGGSDLGLGLETVLDLFGDEPREGGRIVIILSDGEDHAPNWERLVDRMRELGVVVHAISIGDDEQGHPIPVRPARDGERPILMVEDEPIETRRVDRDLRGLTVATGGAFVPIGLATADLADLYAKQIAPVERQARDALQRPEPRHQYGVPLLLGLAIGLIGSWPWKRPAERTKPWWTSWMVLVGVTVLSIGMMGAGERSPRSAAEAIALGRAAFDRGDLDAALDAFEQAERLAPGAPIPPYNSAATLYQFGRFEEAMARYLAARDRADEGLRLKIDYAMGNTALVLGDLYAALGHYDDCLASTIPGASYDLVRSFAEENRSFVARQIETHREALEAEPEAGSPGGTDGREPEQPPDDGPSDGSDGPPDEDAPESDESPDADASITDPTGMVATPGSGTASGRPSRGTGTPADRLSSAVDSIRSARGRRFPDLPRIPPARSDRPTW